MSNDTKYPTICADLRSRINSGILHGKLPNVRELAFEFDVAVGTMQKALATLREEQLIEIRRGLGSFVSIPVQQQTGLIGMVIEHSIEYMSNNIYAAAVFMGIQHALSKAGCALLVVGTPEDLVEKGNTFNVDGLCCYEVFNSESFSLISGYGPVISVEGAPTDVCDTVCIDNIALGRLAAETIKAQGKEKVIYLAVDKGKRKDPAWSDRTTGFKAAAGELGMQVEYRPMDRSVSRTKPDIEAVAAEGLEYDSMVINGAHTARLAMKHFPNLDPSNLIIYGSTRDADTMPCTVVGADFHAIGVQAGQTMLARLRDPKAEPETIMVQPENLTHTLPE